MRVPWLFHLLMCSLAWRFGWQLVGNLDQCEWWMSGLAGMVMSMQWSKQNEVD